MPSPEPAPRPAGLADTDLADLGRDVVDAWDDLLELVGSPSVDLSRPSRLPGWSGRDTLVHLGSWDDAQVLESLVSSARTGDLSDFGDPDEANEALVRAHRGASDDDVIGALVAARDRVARFFASGEAAELGRRMSRSTVGPLPLLCVVHAGTYELAVHGLDLAPCGAPPPSEHLLDRGLASLIDITGALASRHRVELALTGMTPGGGWRFTSSAAGWRTEPVSAGPFDGVGVRGSTLDLLDASAGRKHLPQLLLTRRLHVQHLPQWMHLAPLIEEVPGLPGGGALRTAISGLSGLTGGVGRFLGRFRR